MSEYKPRIHCVDGKWVVTPYGVQRAWVWKAMSFCRFMNGQFTLNGRYVRKL